MILQDYIKGYSRIAIPLFELTKKDVVFKWSLDYHTTFDFLKVALILSLILVKPNFMKAFILDVDWWTSRVGAILSQKEGEIEQIIAYANKGFSLIHKKFHYMEVNVMRWYGE